MNLVEQFIREYPDVYQMMNETDHHDMGSVLGTHLNPYHIEGSIWTHTMMVHNEARQWAPPGSTWNHIFEYAALFHDIGKCHVREVVEKPDGKVRIRFFGHEGLSFFRFMDFKPQLRKDELLATLTMIAMHGDFNDLKDSGQAIRILLKRFHKYPEIFRHLGHFIRCDHHGRINNVYEPHSQDDMWSASWVNMVADMIPNNAIPREVDHQIVVMIGPPGCGKSTYVNTDPGLVDHEVVSRDDILMEQGKEVTGSSDVTYREAWEAVPPKRVDRILAKRFQEMVRDRKNIVVDMTNMSRKARRRWLGSLPEGYHRKAILFNPGYVECHRRNNKREPEGRNVPHSVILNMCSRFVMPMSDEFDEILWEI